MVTEPLTLRKIYDELKEILPEKPIKSKNGNCVWCHSTKHLKTCGWLKGQKLIERIEEILTRNKL